MTDLPSDSGSPTSTGAGPGRLIRQAREQAKLSIEDLGAQIKLARGTLDALERDDFATLSEPVYVRGYYRKLSKVLPVSEAELLSAYEALVAPRLPSPPSKLLLAGEQDLADGRSGGLKLVIGVVLTGLLIGLLAYWGSQRTAGGIADAVTPIQSAPVAPPAESLSAPPAPGAEPLAAPPEGSNQPASLTLAPSLSQAPGAVTAPAPDAALVATPPQPAPAAEVPRPVLGRAEVQLQFNATSWTRIEDATGKSLLSGVIQAGDRQTISGEAPFSIFLGNAPGVVIQFNGKSVDMSQHTKGNNTARFTLP